MEKLYSYIDPKTGQKQDSSKRWNHAVVRQYGEVPTIAIIYDRDVISIFWLQNPEPVYLLRAHGEVVERPQHMLIRAAIGIHGIDLHQCHWDPQSHDEKWFHPPLTLFNAGTPKLNSVPVFCSLWQKTAYREYWDLKQMCQNLRVQGVSDFPSTTSEPRVLISKRYWRQTWHYTQSIQWYSRRQGGKRKGACRIPGTMACWYRWIWT